MHFCRWDSFVHLAVSRCQRLASISRCHLSLCNCRGATWCDRCGKWNKKRKSQPPWCQGAKIYMTYCVKTEHDEILEWWNKHAQWNTRYMILRSAFFDAFGWKGNESSLVSSPKQVRTVPYALCNMCILSFLHSAYSVHCAICFHVLHLHVLHGRRYRIQCHHYHQAGIKGPLFRHISHTFHLPIQPRHTEEIFLCLGQRPGYPSFFSVISMMWGRMRDYHIFSKKW